MKSFLLNNGRQLPGLGLGTWKSKPGEVFLAVKEAIACGYRHIDCAFIYNNEREVGAAVSECIDRGIVHRDDLWITSKLWNSFHRPEDVAAGCRKSLEALQLDRLDLYLVHWPVAFQPGVTMPTDVEGFIPLSELPLATTWAAMESLVDQGLTTSIGVSNCGPARLAQLLDGSRIPPAVNQVELHPYLPQPELLDFCADNSIHVTAYSPLGSPDRPTSMKHEDEPTLLENPIVQERAKAQSITRGQVLIAWALNRGTSVIPKSVNPGRIRENYEAGGILLSGPSRGALDGIETRMRYVNPSGMMIPGVTYTGDSFWA